MRNRPWSVTVAGLFVLVGAFSWIGIAILLVLNAHPAFPDEPVLRNAMAAFSVVAGLLLLELLALLRRGTRWAYFALLSSLVVSALSLFLDDFGVADVVFLLINLAAIGLLLKDRRLYLAGTGSAR